MVQGLDIRGTARGFKVDPSTVLQWLMEAAEQLRAFAQHFLHDIQPTGDDRAGMVVKDGHQRASKAVVLTGGERTDIDCPHDVRRQSFTGAPMAWPAWDRWHRWRMLSQDTLDGIGGGYQALVGADVRQALRGKAGVVCCA